MKIKEQIDPELWRAVEHAKSLTTNWPEWIKSDYAPNCYIRTCNKYNSSPKFFAAYWAMAGGGYKYVVYRDENLLRGEYMTESASWVVERQVEEMLMTLPGLILGPKS